MNSMLSDLVALWSGWMAPILVQSTILMLLVAGFDRLLGQRAWPRLLSAMWMLVLLRLLIPPHFGSEYSAAHWLPRAAIVRPLAVTDATSNQLPLAAWLFAAWGIGLITLSVMTVCKYRRLRKTLLQPAAATPPEWLHEAATRLSRQIGLTRAPKIIVSANATGPAVVGFLRPVVVIPNSDLMDDDRDYVEHTLLHEFAHIRRRDPQWMLVCLMMRLAYWFHPAVWLTCRRLETLRELGCDELVVRTANHNVVSYRETLLQIAQQRLRPAAAGSLGLFGTQSQLLTRLEWLPHMHSPPSRWRLPVTATTIGILSLACLPLAYPAGASTDVPATIDAATERLPTNPLETKDVAETAEPINIPFENLQGSLQVRYAVMALLNQQADAAANSANGDSVEGNQP